MIPSRIHRLYSSAARKLVVVLPALFVAFAAPALDSSLLVHADDHMYGYYPYGWRGRDAAGNIVYRVQSARYTLDTNATRASMRLQLGPAAAALNEANAIPAPAITFHLNVNGRPYVATVAAPKPEDVVLQRVGRFVQHFETRGLTFSAADGASLSDTDAWFECYAWQDRIAITLHLHPTVSLSNVMASIRVTESPQVPEMGSTHAILRAGDVATALVNPLPATQSLSRVDGGVEIRSEISATVAGQLRSVSAVLSMRQPQDDPTRLPLVEAVGVEPYTGPLNVDYDSIRGVHRIALGDNPDKNVTERVKIRISNPSDVSQPVRLCFAKSDGAFAITGMSPVLLDRNGDPVGLPIQTSKNWHVRPAWFDGLTMMELGPQETFDGHFVLAYAYWGGVPAVSHAQLCLVGWGTHQLWDQMAIGSFGESICYDPDVNLQRGMIDDMRPLMVWGMGPEEKRKWSWTHNVGGGDFLVLVQEGKRQYLSNQRTRYDSQGPVLTDVSYFGHTPDGAITSTIRTQSWRSDDYVRALYTLRCDVVKTVGNFDRLAFFQLGADRYNHNLFATVTRGDRDGARESWSPQMGGWNYSRRAESLSGDVPWIALTGARKNPPPYTKEGDQGAWANRGMIVRNWKAKLGGVDVPQPHFSIYGTDDGKVPSAIVELSPPPACGALASGDFVEAVVEMLVLPQRAEDYYGPNQPLVAVLREHPDDFNLVLREAAGNDLRVIASSGVLLESFPIRIDANNGNAAEFTVERGIGYVPVIIDNVKSHAPFVLSEVTDGAGRTIAESGVPFPSWQTRYNPASKSWTFYFTISLDPDDTRRISRTFRFGLR